jgi:tripartite ATP-independent transporter DctM subunit
MNDGNLRTGLLAALDRAAASLAQRLALLGVAGMLVFALLTVVDVLLRKLANTPIPGLYEIGQLILAVIIAASFPAVLAARGNLVIDFLTGAFPPRVKRWLAAAGGLLMLGFLALLAWRMGFYAAELGARNSITLNLAVPTAPFWWAVTALLGICVAVQGVVLAAQIGEAIAGAGPAPAAPRIALGKAGFAASAAVIAVAMLAAAALIAGPGKAGLFAGLAPSTPAGLALLALIAMIALTLLEMPLGAVMGLVGIVGLAHVMGGYNSGLVLLGTNTGQLLINLDLATIPLFIMMGGFAAAAGLSAELYRLAQALLGRLRGGLAYATIGGCAGFGAVNGSSVATAAVIGKVALPEMRAHGYSDRLATGCIAAGGTLGMLIPPSTMMVLYGFLTGTSISALFIAAIVPGLVAAFCYMSAVWIYVRLSPGAAPRAAERRPGEAMAAFKGCWGVLMLFAVVVGGLYGGVFTATEAAAVGAGIAFLFAAVRRRREGPGWILAVLADTAANTGMIYILVIGAQSFATFFGIADVPKLVLAWVEALDLKPFLVVLMILALYLFLGCIMDPITMLLVTVPFVIPLVETMGYNLVWWGIITVMVCEIAMITPPLGVNVFVIKAVAGVPMRTVFAGVTPFVAADTVRLLILAGLPILTLWLPKTMR